MPDENTAGRFYDGPAETDEVASFGTTDEPAPVLTGDEAAALIAQLHAVGLSKGYERVRLDRGRHPDSGDHYELGYVHGEVAARFSHLPNWGVRRPSETAPMEFATRLADNANAAYQESGR